MSRDAAAPGPPTTTDPDGAAIDPDATDQRLDAGHDRDLDEELGEVDPAGVADPGGRAPTTVVFDVGEVVIDESRVWAVWAELLGTTPLTFAAVLGAAIAQGHDHEVAFPHVAPNVDWHDFEQEHERRYGGFREDDLYPDVRPCLAELRELGFTVVLAGNQPVRRTTQLVALTLPVDHVLTSEELGVEKPDPGFFAAVLARVGVTDPHDALYVGDRTDNDVAAAAAAGLRTCWLRRGPWGALQDLPDDVTPDLELEGLGELPLLLEGWRDPA